MRANQLRLWFAAMAYTLLCALRRIGLAHTQFAEATCGTIRLRLLKIGALVRVSVRRIKVAMTSACPLLTSTPSPTPDYVTRPPERGLPPRHPPSEDPDIAEPTHPPPAVTDPRVPPPAAAAKPSRA